MTYMLGAVGGQVLKTSTQLLQLLLVCDFVLAVLHKAMRSTAYQRKGHPRVDGLFVGMPCFASPCARLQEQNRKRAKAGGVECWFSELVHRLHRACKSSVSFHHIVCLMIVVCMSAHVCCMCPCFGLSVCEQTVIDTEHARV